MPRSPSGLDSNVFLALVLCLAPNFKLWLESFHCHSTALEFGNQIFAELFRRVNPVLSLRSNRPVYFIPKWCFMLSQPHFRLSCLISIQRETFLLFKGKMEEGGGGAEGICGVIIFKVTKLVTEKKDKIQDLVPRS